MSQLNFTSLGEVKKRIDPEHDTCHDNLSDNKYYTLQGQPFRYRHSRPLPKETGTKAVSYISALMKRYPFQLRYVLALPYWKRFSESWCDTGDEDKALGAI